MTEYNKFAEGYFTVPSTLNKFISLPFLPNTFQIWNKTQWGAAPTGSTPIATAEYAIGFKEDAPGTYYAYGAVASSSSAALDATKGTTGGFSFINAGTYQYGPTLTISSITQANPAVVTTSTAHNLVTGNAVLIYGTTGMLQVSGVVYTVTVTGADTFTIDVNSNGFAAAASAGFCKQVLYPDLYTPFGCAITAIGTGTTTTVTTAVNHSFVVGQEVFFVIPQVQGSITSWGTTQLDTFLYNTQNVIPQQAYVTAVSANTVTVNVNSTGFTAFAYPTSAQAALGYTYPQILAIGDQNSGATNATNPLPVVPPAITIPGAYAANTRLGVLIGSSVLPQDSDVIRWRATYPDQIQTS